MRDDKAAKELAARALIDLRALGELAGNDRIDDEIFGFLAQQAVEKSLKAWLSFLGRSYPLTHNLDRLFAELKRAGAKASPYAALASLTPFAVQFRYESMDPSEPGLDREATLAAIGGLVGKVLELTGEGPGSRPGLHEPPGPYPARKRKGRGRAKGKKTRK